MPEPPPTSSIEIGPALARSSLLAAVSAEGTDKTAIAGTSCSQNGFSVTAAASEDTGAPVITASGMPAQRPMSAKLKVTYPPVYAGFPSTRNSEASGELQ